MRDEAMTRRGAERKRKRRAVEGIVGELSCRERVVVEREGGGQGPYQSINMGAHRYALDASELQEEGYERRMERIASTKIEAGFGVGERVSMEGGERGRRGAGVVVVLLLEEEIKKDEKEKKKIKGSGQARQGAVAAWPKAG